MCGSVESAASDHLVERTAVGELVVEFATKFTRTAGTRSVEAMYDGWVNVFHEEWLLIKRDETNTPGM
jgi:hypothetical protein